jgi:hypothetical protein
LLGDVATEVPSLAVSARCATVAASLRLSARALARAMCRSGSSMTAANSLNAFSGRLGNGCTTFNSALQKGHVLCALVQPLKHCFFGVMYKN